MVKKPLEEHLADFLLGMHSRGTLSRSYYQACFRIWVETYGQVIAEKVRSIVKERISK